MSAAEFLKEQGISMHTVKAVKFPHKYKNIELELLPLMEQHSDMRVEEYKEGLIKELRDLPTFKIVTVGRDKNRMIRGVYSAIDFKKQAINLINTPE